MNESINILINESLIILNNLHFIRADWFYAFIPLILYLIFANNKTQSNRNWFSVIDKQLLPFVLTTESNKRRRYPLLLTFIAVSLCITALAGPVYKKLPQPVYREQSSLVVLLDLSQSMNATDIKPSRLARAKLELLDILKTRKTGQTALIVYAADAFVVTPLTDDNATIANLVPSLETDMMPAQGSNLTIALNKTAALFKQAGILKGDIVVITDDIRQGDEGAIKKIFSQGFRLSILGTGTAEGAPVPLASGFLQDSNGAIVVPKLHAEKLQKYALGASGLYTGMHADDSDTNKLTQIFQSSEITQDNTTKDLNADIWQEEGYWLLLPLLFFAALWARKGWIAIILIFILPLPQPAYAEAAAAEDSYLNTKHLWSSPDQKAMKNFNAGDNENAARGFTQTDWKASAYYRNGDYQAAADALEKTDHSNGFYNRANAFAKLGNYEEAIKAYDKAIEINESNEDAIYNREQVKKALQQQQQNSEQQDSPQNESDKDESEQDKSDQEKSDQQQAQQEDSEKKDSKQQDSSSQNNEDNQQQSEQSEQQPENNKSDEQRPDESQQQEEQELKQRDAETEKQQQEKEQSQYEKDQQEQKKQDNAEQDSNNKENDNVENKESEDKPREIEVNPMEASITEQEKATEQWLKRIPDDPGGLLRRKFLYQYKQTPNQSDEDEPW